jgi:hypothetical protein
LRLIAEGGVVPSDLVGRATDRSLEQISDPLLENLIGGQPDRIPAIFGLQDLVNLWVCEDGIGAVVPALELASVASHDRLHRFLTTVRRMNVARTKHATFQITELVEHEQRMITGTSEVAVAGGIFLLAVGRLTLESM